MQKVPEEETPLTLFDNIDIFNDAEYLGRDKNILYSDIYRPKNSGAKRLPVIIMIHGGGLFMGSRKMNSYICQIFAEKGYLVYALDYRLLTEANAKQEIADVCSGFDFVEASLDKYQGDSSEVYLVAESAGAFLSIYAIGMMKSKKLREAYGIENKCKLNIKKMACFSGMFYTHRFDIVGVLYPKQIYGKGYRKTELKKYINPEDEEILNNLPQMLLTSSKSDYLKKQTLKYNDALEKAGKSPALIYFKERNKKLNHAFPALNPFLAESTGIINHITDRFFK